MKQEDRLASESFSEWVLPEDKSRAMSAMAILIPITFGFFLVDLSRWHGSTEYSPWLLARGVLVVGFIGLAWLSRTATKLGTLRLGATAVLAYLGLYLATRHFTVNSAELAHHASDAFTVVIVFFIPAYRLGQVLVGITISATALAGLAIATGGVGNLPPGLIAAHLAANAVGFAIAWHLQKEARLRYEAERELKVLRGIIPICAVCKSIRNDSGFWQTVETYVASHADVAFSHGICPTCMEKHYGESL